LTAIRALLDHAIDYAGLFPPAQLSMREAVASYAEYLASPEQWALGRFVLPVNRLDEFAEVAGPALEHTREHWGLAAIGGEDLGAERAAIRAFNATAFAARAECFEFRAGPLEHFRAMAEEGPCEFHRFAEIGWDEPAQGYLAVMQSALIGIKFRTGGVQADAFPPPDALIRQLGAAIRAGVPFKCTAGLHHPVRGLYPLTYEPGAPRAPMYGYLNVMLAAAALRLESGDAIAHGILLEEDPAAFALGTEQIVWRDLRIPAVVLEAMRQEGSLAFGSCSFSEPMDELTRIPAA
jgi:hypothetical protein